MVCDLSLVHMKCPGRKIIALKAAYHNSKGLMALDIKTESEAVIKIEILKLYREAYASVTFILAGDNRAGDEAIFPLEALIR